MTRDVVDFQRWVAIGLCVEEFPHLREAVQSSAIASFDLRPHDLIRWDGVRGGIGDDAADGNDGHDDGDRREELTGHGLVRLCFYNKTKKA